MVVNVDVDTELLLRAHAMGCELTPTATVTRALEEYITRRERAAIVELFGTLEWDTTFDHKVHRSRGAPTGLKHPDRDRRL